MNRYLAITFLCVVAIGAVGGFAQDPSPSRTGQESRPLETRPLDPPLAREIPRGDVALRELLRSVQWTVAVERRRLMANPDATRASLVDVLERQAKSLVELIASRGELVATASEMAKARSLRESCERRLAHVLPEIETPTGLTDPNSVDSESRLRAEKSVAETSATAVATYRSQIRVELERIRRLSEIAPGMMAQAQAEAKEASVAADGAKRLVDRATETGVDIDSLRILEEKTWLARADLAVAESRLGRWELQSGANLDEQIRNLTFQISAEDSKLAMYESRMREASRRIGQAGELRLERGEIELRSLKDALSTAPEWLAPWYRARIITTEARLEASHATRLTEKWGARLYENGEIRSLETEADTAESNFKEVDAGRLELGEVTAGSSGGVRALVDEVHDEIRRIDAFLAEARRDTKDLRERLRNVRGESPELVARRLESIQGTGTAPASFVPRTAEERDALTLRGFATLASQLRSASKERADAFSSVQRQLADASARLVDVRGKVERVRLRLEDIHRWIRDDDGWDLDGLISDLKRFPEASSHAGREIVAAHRLVAERLAATLHQGPSSLGVPLFSLLLVALAVIAAARGSRRLEWPAPGPRRVLRATSALVSAAGGALWLPLLIVSVSLIPAILLDVGAPSIGVVASTTGVLAAVIAGRAISALLVGKKNSDPRILHTSDAMAQVLRVAFGRLLIVGVVLVPIAGLVDALGPPASPFRGLCWALLSFLVEIIVLLAFTRRHAMPAVIRSVHAMGGSARLLLWVAYPAAVLATIFLAALQILSYSAAYLEFRGRFVATGLWLFLGWAMRGWIVRAILGTATAKLPPEAEPSPSTEAWRQLATSYARDRLFRVLASAVYLPAIWLVARAWGLTGEGWDAHFSSKIPFLSDTLTIGDAIQATITIVIANVGIRLARDLLRYRVLPTTDLDPGLRFTIVTLTTYFLITVFAVFILNRQLHLDPSHIGWFITALGLGVGFGLQEIINNFVSGLILLIERPIKVGDMIAIDGTTGRVDVINMRSTTVMTIDNMGLIVPNKDLISNKVTNWSSGSACIRVGIAFGVAYGTDLKKVETIVLAVAGRNPAVLRHPAPDLTMSTFGASSVDFELSFFISLNTVRAKIRSDVMHEIEREFAENGIEIPFPQQDVRIRAMPKGGSGA